MYRRFIEDRLLLALADTPVVCLVGARQTGKTTLVARQIRKRHPARYVTLDDAVALSAARSDPAGFLSAFQGPVILDEVQKAPELFGAVKLAVDTDRRPGRFLLTGSADVLAQSRLSSELVGRAEFLTLWPLSKGEILGEPEGFLETVFGESPFPSIAESPSRDDLAGVILPGGYPEAIARASEGRRGAWFKSYISSLLQRDVRDLANIEGLTDFPRLLSVLAAQACGLLNISDLSRRAAVPQTTLKRYLALLESTFLVERVPAWSGNLGKRMTKSPRLLFCDVGLLAHLLGASSQRLKTDPALLGPLVENFVGLELQKQATWSGFAVSLYHFRTLADAEVDLVLEDASGRLVGIEVKASATVSTHDFRGLKCLASLAGKRFHRGIVLYAGRESVGFGPNLQALPLGALWAAPRS